MPSRKLVSVLVIALLSLLPGVGHGQTQEDVQELQVKEQQLSRKVRALRSEQRQLLLRKMLYSSDSKYLELDLRSGEGALKYRARVLRTFRFTRRGRSSLAAADGGIFALTAKKDGSSAKRRLSFNNDTVIIEGKKAGKGRGLGSSLSLSLSKRDMAAIYYALETGSLAYFK